MASRLLTERVADLGAFRAVTAAGAKLPLWPQNLAHIYVKLELKSESENATTAEEAKGFFRSIARASILAHQIAQQYNGFLLEVQGSTLHVGLQEPHGSTLMDSANAFVTDLHWAYRAVFSDQQKRVQGWRMTIDTGKTLVVVGRGVHNDESYVSLGKSANRPAKHLYAQLAIPNEDDRQLKRFHVALRRQNTMAREQWDHFDLGRSRSRLTMLAKIAEDARRAEPKIAFIEAVGGSKLVTARALPLVPAGLPASPTPEKPHTYFGWVMRADLDGFTGRVEECFDNDMKLTELAEQFYRIMDAAAEFTGGHGETLAQLPWAGDNFTAAAVFPAKLPYDQAIPRRLVELTLDFERDMAESAVECGFGGWAHGVAGGEPHGNATGNIYLAGVEVGERRHLIGVGEGFGRSTQAFGDINPKATEIVVYTQDWTRMDTCYKDAFERAVTVRGEQSTLYHKAAVNGLRHRRLRDATVTVSTPVTHQGGQTRNVPARPYFG